MTVQLVGANHMPIQPTVKNVVHFKTKAEVVASPPAPAPASAAKTYAVSIQQFAFAPKEITVEVNSSITFINND